jgi:DnaK suppressor protein
VTLNIEKYKTRLIAEEKRLHDEVERAALDAREAVDRPVGDAADESVSSEQKEQQFQEADMDRTLLLQVRNALQRIESGTYGQCVVDGGAIEEKRLDAMPWTPYCMKHQQSLEAAHPPRTPTL